LERPGRTANETRRKEAEIGSGQEKTLLITSLEKKEESRIPRLLCLERNPYIVAVSSRGESALACERRSNLSFREGKSYAKESNEGPGRKKKRSGSSQGGEKAFRLRSTEKEVRGREQGGEELMRANRTEGREKTGYIIFRGGGGVASHTHQKEKG